MGDSPKLERRYRRLLALYPRGYREDHNDEMLGVLMDGSDDDQRWPHAGDVGDVVRRALPCRVRASFGRSMDFAVRHAAVVVPVRLAAGIWLVVLGTILCNFHRYYGVALYPVAVLHFVLAYQTVNRSWLKPPAAPPS